MHAYKIGKLNGRFVVYWWDDDGRHRYRLEAQTAAEAEAEGRDIYERATATNGELTISDLWAKYSEGVRGRRVFEDMKYTGRSILPWFGHFRPDQVQPIDCQNYIQDRRTAGIQDGTIWTQLGKLRTCLNWAVKAGLIDRAPHIQRPQKPPPKERYMTREEISRLLKVECAPHVKLAIHLLLGTGARVTAVLELTWDRVDFDRGVINLRSGEGARKGRAVVPMNRRVRAELETAKRGALSAYVIEWSGGRVKSIKKSFSTAAKAAGLSGVSPHVLRHTAAVHMAEAGRSMDEIAQFLGHSDTRVTASVYARYSPEHLRAAADALEFD